MAICLHPYLIGVPLRIAGFDSALAYIRSHDRVWSTRASKSCGTGCKSDATF